MIVVPVYPRDLAEEYGDCSDAVEEFVLESARRQCRWLIWYIFGHAQRRSDRVGFQVESPRLIGSGAHRYAVLVVGQKVLQIQNSVVRQRRSVVAAVRSGNDHQVLDHHMFLPAPVFGLVGRVPLDGRFSRIDYINREIFDGREFHD